MKTHKRHPFFCAEHAAIVLLGERHKKFAQKLLLSGNFMVAGAKASFEELRGR